MSSGFMQFLREFWVIWLMVLFGVVVWWAFRAKNKQRFEEDARIPFKDDGGK